MYDTYKKRIDSLFSAIAHGDEGHRIWLESAINSHFYGTPVPEYVPSRKDSEIESLKAEIERLKAVTNFEEAVACVFDNLKCAAANTSSREWDEQLEDLAEDVIEFAPKYKKEWLDICSLDRRISEVEKRNVQLVELLREVYKYPLEHACSSGSWPAQELCERIDTAIAVIK